MTFTCDISSEGNELLTRILRVLQILVDSLSFLPHRNFSEQSLEIAEYISFARARCLIGKFTFDRGIFIKVHRTLMLGF